MPSKCRSVAIANAAQPAFGDVRGAERHADHPLRMCGHSVLSGSRPVRRLRCVDEAAYRAAEQRMWSSIGLAPSERVVAGIRVQEVGDGPPVLFVHGASNSGVSWATLVRDVAPSFRCIVVDRPGCGLSPKLSQRFDDVAGLRAFAGLFVAGLLDALGLDRAHLVATSFGGLLALHSAAATPERVDRMALFGWSVGAPTSQLPLVMRVASVPVLGRVMARLPVNERVVRAMMKRIGVTDPTDEVVACFTALLRHTPTMHNEIEAGPRIMGLRGLNESILIPHETLRAITSPALFLWGTADPFGGPEVARAFSAKLPNATLELIDGAGHAPWLDDPRRSADAVTSFFAETAAMRQKAGPSPPDQRSDTAPPHAADSAITRSRK